MNWTHEGSFENGDFLIYDEKTDKEIIEIRQGFISKKHLDLILAAPALLECLESLLYVTKGCESHYLDYDIIRDASYKAIHKATGENQ